MNFSTKKALAAFCALAFVTAIAFAQSGTQSSTAKPPATQAKPAAKPGTTAAKPAGPGYDTALLTPSALVRVAPAEFDVKFVTTKGEFTIHVTRAWAPKGADRFYNLARHHFFDGAYFFRVIPGFVAQFGISAYPAVAKVWDSANIKDDPVTHHNVPGTIVFATAGPNTRTSQLFINYRDNTSNLDPQGFAPFGEVTEGMDVVKALSGKYGGDLDQDKIRDGGKAYVQAHYPEMDMIKTATVVLPPAAPKTGAAAKPGTSH